MKYVKEFGIILIVSLVGELLNYFLPLPVPASIYGLALMWSMTMPFWMESMITSSGFSFSITLRIIPRFVSHKSNRFWLNSPIRFARSLI